MPFRRFFSFAAVISLGLSAVLADTIPENKPSHKTPPPVIHSAIGDSSHGVEGRLRMFNIGKRQQFSGADRATFDTDIFSPKSVAFSADGATFFVNSLEGCRTVAYDTHSLAKKFVIDYRFTGRDSALWAAPPPYYSFTHYPDGTNRAFGGKPVEMALSHDGRYLWVPFYRRTFDLNAQDPSAVAVIDTRSGKIVRMFDTGPLPKMIAVNNADTRVAVTHWGNNTVGIIDISSPDIARWHHRPPVTIGHRLELDYPLDTPVNRDAKSGFLLRGTVFTPDGQYLLVSGMAGPLSVIDVEGGRTIAMASNLYGIRHLVIHGGTVYGSCNVAGSVLSFPLDSLLAAAGTPGDGIRNIRVPGVRTVKVGGGARTLEVSPDGAYAFVACNSASRVYAVDLHTMEVADTIRVDSYPVGLALSPDGRTMVVTSQGRDHNGGNAVNIFHISRPDITPANPDTLINPKGPNDLKVPDEPVTDSFDTAPALIIAITLLTAIALLALVAIIIYRRHHRP